MVDDTLTITEAGHETQQINASCRKRLQFSEIKCHTMIVHKSKQINEVSELKVDTWKQTHDDMNVFQDTFDNEHNLKGTNETKYLCCVLFSCGRNPQNIKSEQNHRHKK